MDIGFVWDESKYHKVRRKHRVQFHEVVSVFDDPQGKVTDDPQGHPDRQAWLGRTHAGRLLFVVYSDEDAPLLRLITAYDAEGALAHAYHGR